MNFYSEHGARIHVFDEIFPQLENYFFKKRHSEGEVQNVLMKPTQEAHDILYIYRQEKGVHHPATVSGPTAAAIEMWPYVFESKQLPVKPPTKWQVLKFLFLKITLEAYSKLYEIKSLGEIYYRILYHELAHSYNQDLDMKSATENNDDIAIVILRNKNILNSHTKKWLTQYFVRLERPEQYDNNARTKKGYIQCYNNKSGTPEYQNVLDYDYKHANVSRWFGHNERMKVKWGVTLDTLDEMVADGAFKNIKLPSYYHSEAEKIQNVLKTTTPPPDFYTVDSDLDDDFDDDFDILEDFDENFGYNFDVAPKPPKPKTPKPKNKPLTPSNKPKTPKPKPTKSKPNSQEIARLQQDMKNHLKTETMVSNLYGKKNKMDVIIKILKKHFDTKKSVSDILNASMNNDWSLWIPVWLEITKEESHKIMNLIRKRHAQIKKALTK